MVKGLDQFEKGCIRFRCISARGWWLNVCDVLVSTRCPWAIRRLFCREASGFVHTSVAADSSMWILSGQNPFADWHPRPSGGKVLTHTTPVRRRCGDAIDDAWWYLRKSTGTELIMHRPPEWPRRSIQRTYVNNHGIRYLKGKCDSEIHNRIQREIKDINVATVMHIILNK